MRLTVLGGCGAYPEAGQACSGYLVEHDGFRLLVDLGYAVVPQLLGHLTAADVDAVFISHGHPDHCADLNPLLRARVLGGETLPPLPVYALPGALDAVLALDRPGMLDDGYVLHELTPGGSLDIGPFGVQTRLLPHTRPNAGARLTAGGKVLTYTGDTGPDDGVVALARGADLLLAEASFIDQVPEDSRSTLSSARLQGRQAAAAGTGRLLLTICCRAPIRPPRAPRPGRATAARSAWPPRALSSSLEQAGPRPRTPMALRDESGAVPPSTVMDVRSAGQTRRMDSMAKPEIVSAQEWQQARDELLTAEKQATRALDALAARRRRLPMVRFAGDYVFGTPTGAKALTDLFDGRGQLVVYQFMDLGPDRYCPGCTAFTNNVTSLDSLAEAGVTWVTVSDMPLAQIQAYKARMGWTLPFVSSHGTSFSADCGVGPGFLLSVFLRDGTDVYRTYTTTSRGVDRLMFRQNILDLCPYGRQEAWEDSPPGWPRQPT